VAGEAAMKRLLLVCLLAAACDSATVPAQQNVYDFRLLTPAPEVLRWPTGSTVRAFVVSDANATITGWLRAAVEHAVSIWNAGVLYNEVKLVVVDAIEQTDVVVKYSASESPVVVSSCMPSGGLAFTTFCLTSDGAHLEIFPITGKASSVKFVVTVRSDVASAETIVRRLVTHEFGHVLGIEQHSPSQTDLMYGNTLTRDDLSAADRATLQVLYHTRPDITP
jgi:predicted Zn-dependent protease